jgi:DNA-binding response OmpR family regulator
MPQSCDAKAEAWQYILSVVGYPNGRMNATARTAESIHSDTLWRRAKPVLALVGEGARDERLIAALQLDFELHVSSSLADASRRGEFDGDAQGMLLLASTQTYRRSLAEVRKRTDAPLVVLLRTGHTAERVVALESGADDVLATPYEVAELIARLRAVMRRGANRPQVSRMRIADLEIDLDRHTVRRGDRSIKLSPTEFEMLVALARGEGGVVRAEQLTQEVWGDEGAAAATLHTFMSGLRAKIEEPGRPRLLQTVRGIGYLLAPPEQSA